MHDGGTCHSAGWQYTHDNKYLLLSRAVATRNEVYVYFTQVVMGGKQCHLEAKQHETNSTITIWEIKKIPLCNTERKFVLNISRKII